MVRMLHLGTAAHAVVWKLMLAAVFVFASSSACAVPRLFPRLSLVAQADESSQVGRQVPDFPVARDTTTLRVPVGRRVTLTARVDDAGGATLSYQWRQLSGPTVQLLRAGDRTRSPSSYTQFTARKPGIIVVECRVQFLDAHNIPTGVVIVQRIGVRVLPK